jgi:hypothetical protein
LVLTILATVLRIKRALIRVGKTPRNPAVFFSLAVFTPGERIARKKSVVVFASAALLLGIVPPVSAQPKPQIRARASVNGTSYGKADGTIVGNGTGVSLAAAQVGTKADNTLQAEFMRSTAVGNQTHFPRVAAKWGAAGGNELAQLEKIMGLLVGLPAAVKEEDQNALLGKAADKIKEKGVFALINKGATKGNYLQAETKMLSNPTIAESASAVAKQTQTGAPPRDPKTYEFKQDTTALVNKLPAATREPAAISFGVNRDPVAIQWQTPRLTFALRDLSTDPSNPDNLSLTATSQGGAIAAAVYEMTTKYVNFSDPSTIPVDQESLESKASSLFSLTLGVISDTNGVRELASLDLPAGVGIVDSFGKTGYDNVFKDLLSSTSLKDGTLSFNNDYSFTLTLPGNPNSSILFMSDDSISVAGAVPEPASWVLASIGIVGLIGYIAHLHRALGRGASSRARVQ